ncbi:YceD family protein [Kangsaoukella pontilimi]|nr:DUF177 domain-containing protein [Kangsaoukella pontilimi]
MSDPQDAPIRLSGETRQRSFLVEPDAGARVKIAEDLGISAVKKLRFEGTVSPDAARDWRLEAKLGATVVQPCVVTLEPVTTRIDVPVVRRYLADMPQPEAAAGAEVEMPEDDSAEPLPGSVDPAAVMVEALALALPDFPRAEGVDPVEISVTEPGQTPMTDDDAKPFAGLASLRDRLEKKDDDEG